jgi:hypothetical protein
MKLYNDQRNVKFLVDLSIYFCLGMFRAEAGVQLRQWFKSSRYGVSARSRMELYISIHHTQETGTTAEIVHLPLKMG